MPDSVSSNKRIAKNTFILYLRMIFILCVGLYTSRIVLNTLGVEDYGIYNVVGGFVTFFSFLNGAMSNATQRFITFELARGDIKKQIMTFSTAAIIHFVIALLIVIVAETLGLWFVYHKLVIPEERFVAAIWVYQFSILTMFVLIVSIPYNAVIIAHEKMSAFAYISILDVVLKLVIVYLLTIVTFDRLIFYAALLLSISILDRLIYGIYCKRHFKEARVKLMFNKRIFKEMANIAGWSLFGNIAGVFYTQGLNVLLNMFFGPIVNAARAIAVTIQGVVTGFVSNFQMALNPQITKSYATGDLSRMHSLIFASSKYSFFLLLLIVLPIMIETQTILAVWLKNVPAHTVWFVRIILCILLIDALSNPLMISSQAVGQVKVYQSVVGGLLLLILPIAYIALKLGGNPEMVFIVHLIISMVALICRIMIVGRMVSFSLVQYAHKVLLPTISVFTLASCMSISIYYTMTNQSLLKTVIVIILSIVMTAISILFVGLNTSERNLIYTKINTLRYRSHD